MRVFLSGVIQGSHNGAGVADQGYRRQITAILRAWQPDIDVIDPWAIWPDAVDYDMAKAKTVLLEELALAQRADALIAYLPSASMGSALEMLSAYQAGVPIYTITTLNRNWAVHALSTRVFDSLETFAAFVQADGLLARDVSEGGSGDTRSWL